MGIIRCPTSQDDLIMNLPMDTDMNRYEKPVRTPIGITGMTKPELKSSLQRELTTAAEVGREQYDLTEPSRCQATDMEAEGAVTDAIMSIPYRCCDCGIRMTTGRNSATDCDKDREPRLIQTCSVRPETAPVDGGTDILRPMNNLDVPALRLPVVFLKLAEEARNSKVVDDQPTDMRAVQPHRTGQAGRILITEIMNSPPVLGSGAFRVSKTSTEVIPDINLVEPVIRSGPVAHQRDTEQPITLGVMTNQGTNSSAGPVGHDVMLAGRMEMVDQPDLVGPHEETEQSVFLGLDTDQVEHFPPNKVHPGVKMFHIQPVADGPAGPDRTCRPVGNDVLHAVQDEVRPLAGGPVGRFPDPSSLTYSKMSSPDDSYQPLVTGPLGTNVMSASNNAGRPTAGGPLGRPFSLDPMGPRAMFSLGDGNQPASTSPVGRPWIPGQPGNQVVEPDYERSTQTRRESESDTGALDSVIRTESEVHTGRVNTSVANGQTNSSVVSSSSDPVMYGLRKQMYRTKRESESAAGIPDPVIRTGSKVQTDGVNIGMVNGQTDSSVTSPSSDSGVHSLGEQWENMSTCSGNSGSIQTIKTFYGGVASQADKQNPQDTRKVVFCKGATCGENDSMSSSSTDSHNSDIAAMSDFSDEEDGPQGEVRLNVRTECVSDDSIKKESNSCDRSVPDMPTKGVGSNSLDANDKEYWTKFRLLTRQAFLLDDAKLAESDYPDAVKELVLKSRLTIMEINERDDTLFEQCKEGEPSDYFDDECESSMPDDDFLVIDWRIIRIGTIIGRRLSTF